MYMSMRTGELADLVRPGMTVAVGDGCGAPVSVSRALSEAVARSGRVRLVLGWVPRVDPGLALDAFADVRTFMPGWGLRRGVDAGLVKFAPARLSAVPALLHGPWRPDLLVATVVPANGGFTFGSEVSWQRAAIDAGAQVAAVVSRAAPELVQHLFQTEVPEIYDGTVVIRAIAREAGERTKIAVMSKDKEVDAVGACVGMKGMRVQSIIRELRGEKIDIIEYHEDSVTFAEKALQPAKVSRVTIVDPADKHLEVVVDDSQLSLAIGKKGQNVRLAAKLLGWKIDIKSEEEKRQEVEEQMAQLTGTAATPLENVEGLGEGLVEKLKGARISTVEALADMTPEQLEAIEGIGPKTVEKISLAVNNYFAGLEGGEAVALPENDGEEAAAAGAESAATDSASVEEIDAEAAADGGEGEIEAAPEPSEQPGTSEADKLPEEAAENAEQKE